MNDEHTHEEMLFRIATLEEQVRALTTWAELHQRQSMDNALALVGPDTPSREAQREVERVLGFQGSAYLDAMNHDRGTGG